ncbi:hypothetical protein YC2023_120136 [Brassica napus]
MDIRRIIILHFQRCLALIFRGALNQVSPKENTIITTFKCESCNPQLPNHGTALKLLNLL